MSVKIRLQRKGRKKKPYYHIVIADARAPRDGRYIERIGFYNPLTVPATIELDREKALEWIYKGAQPTDTVRAMLRFKGVMYRKHLLRGVSKGALTQEQADSMYQEWIDKKEAKIQARREQHEVELKAIQDQIFGKPKQRKAPVVAEVPSSGGGKDSETADPADDAPQSDTPELDAAKAQVAVEHQAGEEALAEAAPAADAAEAPAEEAAPKEEPAADTPAKEEPEAPAKEEPAAEEEKGSKDSEEE